MLVAFIYTIIGLSVWFYAITVGRKSLHYFKLWRYSKKYYNLLMSSLYFVLYCLVIYIGIPFVLAFWW